MSNFLAIATVTEVLRSLIAEATADAVSELQLDVTTKRPDALATAEGKANVNLFLYQVLPNSAWRNASLPTRSFDGIPVDRPLAALNLRYLLSFSGEGSGLVAERLLGATLAMFETRPQLSRTHIRAVIEAQRQAKPFLAQSDLADQVELVKLTALPLDLEELSKLWSVFFQVPYSLSLAYEASVVLIESNLAPQKPLPVRGPAPPDGLDGRFLQGEPFRHPHIEKVVLSSSKTLSGDEVAMLRILGHHLRGESTVVTFGGVPVGPFDAPEEGPLDTEILLPLTSPPVPAEAIRAGIIGVQVVQERMLGKPPALRRVLESNVVPFVLRPKVVSVTAENMKPDPVTSSSSEPISASTVSGDLRLQIEPPVGKRQRVVVLLNELLLPSPPGSNPDGSALAYSFEVPSRNSPGAPECSGAIVTPIQHVLPRDYLVRVQVDGAESLLNLDTADESLLDLDTAEVVVAPQYMRPKVTIP